MLKLLHSNRYNNLNNQRLINAINVFTEECTNFLCDEESFTQNFRQYLNLSVRTYSTPRVLFDISVCSSKLILSAIKILFEFDIYLTVVYTEAEVYHPTEEEYESETSRFMMDEDFGISKGVGIVQPSFEHPGANIENPNIIFKPMWKKLE